MRDGTPLATSHRETQSPHELVIARRRFWTLNYERLHGVEAICPNWSIPTKKIPLVSSTRCPSAKTHFLRFSALENSLLCVWKWNHNFSQLLATLRALAPSRLNKNKPCTPLCENLLLSFSLRWKINTHKQEKPGNDLPIKEPWPKKIFVARQRPWIGQSHWFIDLFYDLLIKKTKKK